MDSLNDNLTAGEITRLLSDSAAGALDARDRLIAVVYQELHTMARARMRDERPGHTLGATALVSETYLRLFRVAGVDGPDQLPWADRAAFFGAAATAMRRILVDHARAKASQKRGGDAGRSASRRIALDAVEVVETLSPEEFLSLDEAISRLEQIDARAAQVVRLRFFAGQEIAAVAELLNVTDRTIKRDWEFARAWLMQALDSAETE